MTRASTKFGVHVPCDGGVLIPRWGRKPKRGHAAAWVLLFAAAVWSGLTFAQSGVLKHGLSPVYGNPASYELDLPGLDGKQYRLTEYRGKVVIVNFWATWCPPCIEEMPKLQQVWDMLRHENFEVLAVNLGQDEETIRRFLDRFEPKLRFPILVAADETIVETWRIEGLPTSYIVDPAGRLAYRELGPRDFSHEHIVSRLRTLMAGDD